MSDPLPPLRDVIAKHNLGAKKSLGQHFLLDLNLTGRIARTAGDLSQGTVIEIGPGPGGLTRAILEAGAKRLIVIERDARCLDVMAEISEAYPGRLEVIEGDAMEVNVHELGDGPRKIIANLPYNISAPLTLGWIKHIDAFESMVLMYQKEVADRLCAQPGDKAYGRLSILPQWLCEVRPAFMVGRKAFTPPPKVESTVVKFTPRDKPLAEADYDTLERVVAVAFNQRRKMLRASLKALPVKPEELLASAGIEPTLRAEKLSIEEFCALAREFQKITQP